MIRRSLISGRSAFFLTQCVYVFRNILTFFQKSDQLIRSFVMQIRCILFQVKAEFLNIITFSSRFNMCRKTLWNISCVPVYLLGLHEYQINTQSVRRTSAVKWHLAWNTLNIKTTNKYTDICQQMLRYIGRPVYIDLYNNKWLLNGKYCWHTINNLMSQSKSLRSGLYLRKIITFWKIIIFMTQK